jgi:hypothetical protein
MARKNGRGGGGSGGNQNLWNNNRQHGHGKNKNNNNNNNNREEEGQWQFQKVWKNTTNNNQNQNSAWKEGYKDQNQNHHKNPQSGAGKKNRKDKKGNQAQWNNKKDQNKGGWGKNNKGNRKKERWKKDDSDKSVNDWKNKNKNNKWNQNSDNSKQYFTNHSWDPPKTPTFTQSTGRPSYDPFHSNNWWSVPFQNPPFQLLRGKFDTSKDPPQNPFTHRQTKTQYRSPLEIDFENIIGWQEVVHEYADKDNPAVEYCCSTCIALAQQLLIAQTGVQGAPEFYYDLDMKSPGLIDPESLNSFLEQVVNTVKERNGEKLVDILQIEPPFAPAYEQLISDLRRRYPAGSDERIETICEQRMQDFLDEIDTTWGAFPLFLREYFRFIRDVDIANLVITHAQLMGLLKYVPPNLFHPHTNKADNVSTLSPTPTSASSSSQPSFATPNSSPNSLSASTIVPS